MKISAVIVTYHPDAKIVEACLERLINEQGGRLGRVFIVENDSGAEVAREVTRVAAKFQNVLVIENPRNVGLAAGLNIGVKQALAEGSDWVMILDDDSVVPPGMVKTMIAAWNALPEDQRERVGILAPNYATIKGTTYPQNEPTIIPTAITSGQLIRADVFNHIGFFEEDLFIECVDHEFCFRAKQHGLETMLIPSVVLQQRIGTPVIKNFLGKKFVVANHPPFRYYYIFRNSIYIYKKYWRMVPGWILRNKIANILILAKMLFLEENKQAKTAMAFWGIADGFRGKLGMLPVSEMKR
jgi:rhamnosyltransferase